MGLHYESAAPTAELRARSLNFNNLRWFTQAALFDCGEIVGTLPAPTAAARAFLPVSAVPPVVQSQAKNVNSPLRIANVCTVLLFMLNHRTNSKP